MIKHYGVYRLDTMSGMRVVTCDEVDVPHQLQPGEGMVEVPVMFQPNFDVVSDPGGNLRAVPRSGELQ